MVYTMLFCPELGVYRLRNETKKLEKVLTPDDVQKETQPLLREWIATAHRNVNTKVER